MASDETPRPARPERKGLLTNASWNGAYVALTMVLSFVATPLLLEHLGEVSYGLLLVIWSVAGILGSMDLGLGEATVRFIARYLSRDDLKSANRVFTASLSLFSLICAALVASVLVAAPTLAHWLIGTSDAITAKECGPLVTGSLVTGPNVAPSLVGLLNELAAARLIENLETGSELLRIAAFTIAISILTKVYAAVPAAVHRFDVSNKVLMTSSLLRSAGHITIVLSGLGLHALIVWDLCLSIVTFGVATVVVRALLPDLRAFPRLSLHGIREVLGYSIYSFLTFFLHKGHVESGKIIISGSLGLDLVPRLATPDNIAQRFREVLTGGLESTFPRFSESSDKEVSAALLWRATWAVVALSTILFVPFITIVPAFLELWIDPEDVGEGFFEAAGRVGPLLGLYLILQNSFGAHAVYFRGTGRPWVVTIVTSVALAITVTTAVFLVRTNGAVGAAEAFVAGSAASVLALFITSFTEFGPAAFRHLLRAVVVPLLCGGVAFAACWQAQHLIGTSSWVRIVPTGALLTAICVTIVFGVDQLLHGSDGVSNQILRKVARKLPNRFMPGFLRDEERA